MSYRPPLCFGISLQHMDVDSPSVPKSRVVLELRPSATQAGHGMDHTPGAIGFSWLGVGGHWSRDERAVSRLLDPIGAYWLSHHACLGTPR